MKNLLLTGNMASLAPHLCQRLSRQYHVVAAAREMPPIVLGKGVEVYDLNRGKTLEQVFQTHSFQAMIFLATRGEQQTRVAGEADLLSSALALAKRFGAERALFITSGELSSHREAEGERGLLLQAMEQLCAAYRRQGLEVTVLRLPCVFGPGEADTLIGRMLAGAVRRETVAIPFSRDALADFVSAAEVAQLVFRLLARSEAPEELLMVRGAEALSVRELTALFGLLGASVSQGTDETGFPPMEESDLQSYGFTPSERLSVALDSLYASVKAAQGGQEASGGNLISFLRRQPAIIRGASLVLGYVALEAVALLWPQLPLSAVELGLIYTALIGAAHGLQTGLIAVILASFFVARSYGAQGTELSSLLMNWQDAIPFLALLLTGAMAGALRDGGRREARAAAEAAAALEKRCVFLQDLYKQLLLNREQATQPEEQAKLTEQMDQILLGQERLQEAWQALLSREASMQRRNGPAPQQAAPEKQPPLKPRKRQEDGMSIVVTQEEEAPKEEQTPSPQQINEPAEWPAPRKGFPARPARELAQGSPLGQMSLAERRQMLEALQVRAKARGAGKPRRRR